MIARPRADECKPLHLLCQSVRQAADFDSCPVLPHDRRRRHAIVRRAHTMAATDGGPERAPQQTGVFVRGVRCEPFHRQIDGIRPSWSSPLRCFPRTSRLLFPRTSTPRPLRRSGFSLRRRPTPPRRHPRLSLAPHAAAPPSARTPTPLGAVPAAQCERQRVGYLICVGGRREGASGIRRTVAGC
jgi:hypothetical protein